MHRRGQTTVEYMFVIAVIVIAVVLAGAMFGSPFVRAMFRLTERTETAYSDGSITR